MKPQLFTLAFALFIGLTLLLALPAIFSTAVQAAPTAVITLDVDTNSDSNDAAYQVCSAAANDCSLRGAISQANADTANDYIVNLPAGTYQLSIAPDVTPDDNADGDLDILGTITIQGAGMGVSLIQAGASLGSGIDRVFHVVNGSANLTLKDVGVRYGMASVNGGGVYNQGTLWVENSAIISNTAEAQSAVGGKGGGVYNLDNLTITNSQVKNNVATNVGIGVVQPGNLSGGGLYNDGGVLTITATLIMSNSASHTGGGLYNVGGALNISATQIVSNTADGSAGVYIQSGTADIRSSVISGNVSTDFDSGGINNQGDLNLSDGAVRSNRSQGDGGGIYNQGTMSITRSTVAENTAVIGNGAGIYNTAGTLTISATTVYSNTASDTGGGIYNTTGDVSIASSAIADNSANGSGGGIASQNGTLHILASTISGNQATGTASGGGISTANSTVNIANCTLSGNSAGGDGGGIYNIGAGGVSVINVSNCTFSGNSAANGGALANVAFFGTAPAVISNSIMTQSSGGDCSNSGSLSGGNNLIDDNSSGACSGISAAAVTGFEAALYDNGPSGSNPIRRTHMLLPGSNAIDGVPAGSCRYGSSAGNPLFTNGAPISLDQRGEGRAVDYDRNGSSLCDIGAFERQADETFDAAVNDGGNLRFGATMVFIQDNNGGNAPGQTAVARYNQPPGGGVPGAGEMPFHVVITPTLDTGLDINLTLCYDDSELNGLSESSLSLYRYSAPNWLPVTPDSRDTLGNCVMKNNVSGLSAWTLGTNTPTAVALQSFSAARQSAGWVMLLASALLLTFGGRWLWWRKVSLGDFPWRIWLLMALLLPFIAVPAHAWPSAGSLAAAHEFHTATLLPDGRILVVGGSDDGFSPLATAELYDPASSTWSAAASLTTARLGHTATLLPNGRVLVTGGYDGSSSLASAELYDPASNTWSLAASLATARGGHTATLLADGRLLVVGGDDGSVPLSSVELYDPSANSWTAAANLGTARTNHTATLLPDSNVLIVGGWDSGVPPLTGVERYDPAADSWSAAADAPVGRSSHTATLLADGRVLAAGGEDSNGYPMSSVGLYDPVADSWAAAANLTTARSQHTAALLADGRLLVAGGLGIMGSPLASVELYDPTINIWGSGANLTNPRSNHTATLMADGRLLITGGEGNSGVLAAVERYDPNTANWTAAASLSPGIAGHTATLLPDGQVLTVGGWNGSAMAGASLYDPAANSWTAAASPAAPRADHTATLLPDGRVLIVGGQDFGGCLSSAAFYDPVANGWAAAASSTSICGNHTATLLPDGRVLVVGGWVGGSALNTAALYDPASDSWSAAASLTDARYSHTATLLPDGRVLVVGGSNSGGYLASAELYDPAANTWAAAASLTNARQRHTATLLPNGRVLVAGGDTNAGALTSAELYDPAANTWAAAASLTTARYQPATTLLPDGQVLFVGGGDNYDDPIASVELYDPGANSWRTVASLASARADHTATLLLDGRLLVVGGTDINSNPIASAELYDRGLGFNDAWRPQIGSISNPLPLGSRMKITGGQLRGISEASHGGTDYPLAQLRSLTNEQVVWLTPASGLGWSDGHFSSTAVANFPAGPTLVTLFTNGIPSQSAMIQVANGIIWDNDSGDDLWSTAINWSSDSVPTAMDTVVFNTASTTNALIDAGFNGRVNGIFVDDGYTGEISMARSLTATTGLTLRDGTLTVSDPGTQLLTVGWNTQHTGGVMQQTQTVGVGHAPFLQIEDGYGRVRYRGAEVDTTGTNTDVGGVTVRIRGRYVNEYCTSDGSASPVYARRCFEINVTGTNGPADLTLFVPASELNGVNEVSLAMYRYVGGVWTQLVFSNRGRNGGFSFVSAATPGFSHFLLAGDNEAGPGDTPTAVTLHSLSTGNSNTAVLPTLVAALLLAALGGVALRRRSGA